MSRIFALLFLLLVITPIAAQDGYPLPNDLTPITIDNAAHIEKLATLGTAAPGALVWSPDGNTLAVTTNDAVRLYQGAELAASPHLFPTGKAAFESDTVLVIDGQRWDIQTGEKLAELPAPARPILSPSGKIEVLPQATDEGLTIQLKYQDGRETTLAIGSDFDFKDIVFSPDEQYAILILQQYSYDSSYPDLQLWNIENGKFVADLAHTLEILDTVTFHAGGKIIVTSATTDAVYGSVFEEVGIWDGQTGEQIGPELGEGMLPVYFSPDSRLFAYFTAFTGEKISIWSDHEIGALAYDYGGTRPEIVFSPDGHTLITTTYDGQILFWDVSTEPLPSEPVMILEAEAPVLTPLYTPDGKQLISVETDGIIEVWDTQTGERLAHTQADHTDFRTSLSQDGRWLRTGNWDGQTFLFDVATLKLMLTVPNGAVWTADWSQVAYWDSGRVWIADPLTGQTIELRVIENFLGTMADYSPRTAVAVFAQTTFQGYDLSTGQNIFSQPIAENSLAQVSFSANGRYFLTNLDPSGYRPQNPQQITLWDVTNLENPVSAFEVQDNQGGYRLSPDGQLLSILNSACGDGGGGSYHLWSTITGQPVFDWNPGGTCGPYDHTFTPDGKYVIVAWDSYLTILDTTATQETTVPQATPSVQTLTSQVDYGGWQIIDDIWLSPTSDKIAVSATQYNYEISEDAIGYGIDLYSTDAAMFHIPDATSAVFNPNGHWLLTDNGFWNTATGEQTAAVAGQIAAFSPDGTILATVDTTGVTLWDVAALLQGEEIPLATWAVSSVSDVAFNPDATRLYVRRASDIQTWGIPKR